MLGYRKIINKKLITSSCKTFHPAAAWKQTFFKHGLTSNRFSYRPFWKGRTLMPNEKYLIQVKIYKQRR